MFCILPEGAGLFKRRKNCVSYHFTFEWMSIVKHPLVGHDRKRPTDLATSLFPIHIFCKYPSCNQLNYDQKLQ